MVISGQQLSKSTFGAYNEAMKKDTQVGCTLECKGPIYLNSFLELKFIEGAKLLCGVGQIWQFANSSCASGLTL